MTLTAKVHNLELLRRYLFILLLFFLYLFKINIVMSVNVSFIFIFFYVDNLNGNRCISSRKRLKIIII